MKAEIIVAETDFATGGMVNGTILANAVCRVTSRSIPEWMRWENVGADVPMVSFIDTGGVEFPSLLLNHKGEDYGTETGCL